ncbi:hypothetical protein [Nocardia higoensis]|uniref:hypothetical protein n=1 Tax=Nocardia higoensis TaxID=228599 RepID=UPI0012F65EA8|nr:hypothetical protein [Nocardia higoensis]
MPEMSGLIPVEMDVRSDVWEPQYPPPGADGDSVVNGLHAENAATEPAYRYAKTVQGASLAYYEPEDVTATPEMKESNHAFVCPIGRVVVGRKHVGDENGRTTYFHAPLRLSGGDLLQTEQMEWFTTKTSDEKFAREGCVVVGRRHHGDENSPTEYLLARVYSKRGDRKAYLNTIDSKEGAWLKESSGDAAMAPPNKVMTGREHHGDENGKTRYTWSYCYAGESADTGR